jgi:ADP-ribose pyrophosphatase YjhB (NUDIX family)
VLCVGAIIHDRVGRLLLVQRGRDPGRGLWSIPGGRVEPGESEDAALRREVAEETGLTVHVGRLAGRVHRPAPDGSVYDIGDYVCEVLGDASPVAGDDADDVRWVSAAEFDELPVVEGMREVLAEWDALPPGWARPTPAG